MKQQYDLFGGLPPHVKDSDTSKAAAVSMKENAATIRGRVLGMIEQAGGHGLTCDEVEELSGFTHQTASARIRELALTAKIQDSGQRRKTRSGRLAVAWMKKEKP